MVEFKLVLNQRNGKSFSKIVKDKEASVLLKKRIGDRISGQDLNLPGYELEITGGSDKCGFPLRKGILQKRQKIFICGRGLGFSGQDRNKKKQKGLKRKKTVCGEQITLDTVQINLKILKEPSSKLEEKESKKEETSPEK